MLRLKRQVERSEREKKRLIIMYIKWSLRNNCSHEEVERYGREGEVVRGGVGRGEVEEEKEAPGTH